MSEYLSMLKSFDKDGDGQITEKDFVLCAEHFGLGSVGGMAAKALFKKIDKNKNGKLDMSEALGAIKHLKKLVDQNKTPS